MTDEFDELDNPETDSGEALEPSVTRPKWLVAGAVALVLGAVAYGLLHARALQRARASQVADLLASGREQEKSAHYKQALDDFDKAEKLAAAGSGVWRSFTATLSQQQTQAHDALEQLAENWIWQQVTQRMEHGNSGADETPIKALSAYAQSATGSHKADLLAYIGYGSFLKGCLANGDAADQQPETYYREALAADPQNPYAHAFWAHLILCSGGNIDEAQPHFDAALASHRDRERVRDVELYALSDSRNIKVVSNYLWLKLVNEMHKAGEPLGASPLEILASDYGTGSDSRKERKELYAAVPAADHVQLTRYLLESEGAGASTLAVKVMLAYSLEASGNKAEALAAWQDVERSGQELHDLHYTAATRHAFKRLGGAKVHRAKRSHGKVKKSHLARLNR